MTKDAWLTLYFIPSPYGLDWSSPTSLARDIVKNKIARDRRFMGHVNIELKYTNENNQPVHIHTGMVAANLNAPALLLKEKIGLGVVFHSFPGRLENKEELASEYEKRFQKGNGSLNFVKYKINQKAAKRVEEYVADFALHNIDRYYGLVNSPLHGEGSGCSAFGASFLAITGLLEQEHKEHWTHCVKIPHKLAGNPLKENKVSFFDLVLKSHEWAHESEDHHEIFFWDPDRMHAWVENKIKNYQSQLSTYSLEKKGNVTGLFYDVTHKEVPDGPIFKVTSNDGKPVSKLPDLNHQTNIWKYE